MLETPSGLLIPSKEFELWRRLYGRFMLEPYPTDGSIAFVSSVIQPVTQIDELARSIVLQVGTVSITADGTFYGLTVPAEERWRVRSISIGQSAGTWNHEEIRIRDASENELLQLLIYTAQNGTQPFQPGGELTLDQFDQIGAQISSQSVTGDMRVAAWTEVERAY